LESGSFFEAAHEAVIPATGKGLAKLWLVVLLRRPTPTDADERKTWGGWIAAIGPHE
jgi:hypothetical protein